MEFTNVKITFYNATIQNDINKLEEIINSKIDNFDVDQVLLKGSTALQLAVKNEHTKVVDFLLKNSANVHLTDKNGNSYLHLAATTGNLDIVNLFLRKIDINVVNRRGFTPLHAAVIGNKLDVVRLLLKNKARVNTSNRKDGWSPLHDAVSNKSLPLVETLLSFRADPNVLNSDEWSPFHFFFPNFPDNMELFDYFLKCGASMSVQANGRTVLHLAAKYSSLDIMKKLMRTKLTRVNERNNKRYTALHLAIESTIPTYPKEMLIKKVQYLVNRHAKVHTTSLSNRCPLFSAVKAKRYSVLKYLLKHGADVNGFRWSIPIHAAVENNDVKAINFLINCKGFSWESTDSRGNNSLLHAIIRVEDDEARYNLVRFLLNKGADVNCCNARSKVTALQLALDKCDVKLFHFLIGQGALVKVKNHWGQTALFTAAQQNLYDAAKTLIDLGVEVNDCDKNGHSVLSYAAESGSVNMVELMIRNGAIVVNDDNALLASARSEDVKVCSLLVDEGAAVNLNSPITQKMLIIAIINKLPGTVHYLLALGSDINFEYERGSPLGYAIAVVQNNVENEQARETLLHLIRRIALLKSMNAPVHEHYMECIKSEPVLLNAYNRYFDELIKMK